jgi:uncharacterized protein YjiS (DUF1127 family)
MAVRTTGATGHRSAASFGDLVQRLADRYQVWSRRAASREELLNLDDRLLSDIGLTPGDAAAEAAKPFWRA